MSDKASIAQMPAELAAIVECGYATWANDDVEKALRARFDDQRIPVVGIRHVRIWGLQVDDERVLPGLERTGMADEELWEVNLEARNGSKYEIESRLLKPAPE
jgi:hypothetical protein